ncbi:hypothetical protein CDAR_289631 [Caerostris darwini]|uniref:Uncharacterized protein n=1 Tax=Caerostris darwini TaxID=1538125 RepID=A0AAV4WY74_9ARAC|nr:hypothetical protein CDAR_289631 [Caerostris darwini]
MHAIIIVTLWSGTPGSFIKEITCFDEEESNCLGRGDWSNGASSLQRRVIKFFKKGKSARKEFLSGEHSGLARQRSFTYQIALFIVTDISKHEGFTRCELFANC